MLECVSLKLSHASEAKIPYRRGSLQTDVSACADVCFCLCVCVCAVVCWLGLMVVALMVLMMVVVVVVEVVVVMVVCVRGEGGPHLPSWRHCALRQAPQFR